MRTPGTVLSALCIMFVCSCNPKPKDGNEEGRPNIIFMMADDHAAPAISCYGSHLAEIAPTPNLDRIAGDGMRFNNCFCTNSICTPSRAVILTGLHSHQNGVLDLSDKLDSTLHVSFPTLLQRHGYHTGVIGKWHLHVKPFGFDYWKVMVNQGQYHDPYYWEKGVGWKPNNDGAKQYAGYVTDITTGFAMEFLKNRPKEKPFCLLLHFKAPHDPFDHHEKYKPLFDDVDIPEPETLFDDYTTRGEGIKICTQKIGDCHTIYEEETGHLKGQERKKMQYQVYMKKYLRCIASIDENVGLLLDYLDKEGLADNTLIVYTSDQGFYLGEHGMYDKRFMYEESARMPLLVRYPSGIESGQVNKGLVSNLDFAQTFLDYAGVDDPEEMQGRSLRPLLENQQTDWRDGLYYRYWMHGAHFNIPGHLGIRTREYKLIFFYGHDLGTHHDMNYQQGGTWTKEGRNLRDWEITEPYWEFYDLKKDPNEMNNLYDSPDYQKTIADLKIQLREMKKEYGDRDAEFPEMESIVKEYW